MPAVSKAQLIAMRMAAAGKSSLGIPKKVGAEYVKATPKGATLPARAPDPSPAHEAKESPAAEAYEHQTGQEAQDAHLAHCKECYDRHTKMAQKAPSRASRQFHKKMAKHYEGKLKK